MSQHPRAVHTDDEDFGDADTNAAIITTPAGTYSDQRGCIFGRYNVGEHVDDNALTPSLNRLTRAGLVRIDAIRSGRRPIKTYSLSDRGREHLAIYEALVAVYTHLPSAK